MIAELVRPCVDIRAAVQLRSARLAVALIALLSTAALGACGRSSLRTLGFDGGNVQAGAGGNDGGRAGSGGVAGNDGGVDRPDGRAGADGGAGSTAGTGGRIPVQLVVSPSFSVVPVGGQESFTATVFYSDGSAADVTTSAAWSPSDPQVALVKVGTAIGFREGKSLITATFGGISGSATLVVMSSIVLVSVNIDPAMGVLAIGSSAQLTATGFYSDGSTADVTASVLWGSTSPDVATVDTGRVTAWKAGGTTITANVGGLAAKAFISVTPATVVALTVLPPFATVGVGGSARFFADATLSDGTHLDVTNAAFWGVDGAVAAIDGRGVATGTADGKSLITASFGGATGFGTLVVTGATLKFLQIDPLDPTLGLGVSVDFRVTGFYADGTKADVTSQAMWQSSNPSVVVLDGFGRGFTKSIGTSIVSATVGNQGVATTVSVVPAALKSLSIDPSDVLLAPGGAARLTAWATYADGTVIDVTSSVTWTIAPPGIASVSNAAGSAGVVTALQAGMAIVAARFGGIVQTARVIVSPAVLNTLTIEPANSQLPVGSSIPLVARGVFSDNTTRDLTNEVFWTSTDDATATVTNIGGGRSAGVVTGVKAGSVTISAFSVGVAAKATVTVRSPTLSSIVVNPPDGAMLMASTFPYRCSATGVYSDGSRADLTAQVVWTTDNAVVATVSNLGGAEGQLIARSAGTVVVTATLGAVSGRSKLIVTGGAPIALALQPLATSTSVGTPVQFTATLILSDGTTRNVTGQAQWSSSNPMAAAIAGPGRAVPVAAGPTTIGVSYLGFSASTTLTVTAAVVVSLGVSPIAPTLPVGTVGQLTATAIFSDGSTRNVTNNATWSSSAPGIVGVNTARNRGRITAVSQGKAEVTASYMGLSGSTTVAVSDAIVTEISVSPIGLSLPVGARRQFTAQAIRSDGTSFSVTAQATWTSDEPGVADVSAGGPTRGQVVALSSGTANIKATYMGLTGSAPVTVIVATLKSIQVTPFTPTLSTGSTQPFVATALFSDGTSAVVTGVAVWRSSDENVAGVSNAAASRGLVTTLLKGTTSISATYMGVTGATTLSVTEATVLQIQVTPFAPTIPSGFPRQFTATAIYSDGTNRNITPLATWTSSNPAVAGVSDAPGTKGVLTTFVSGTTTIEAQYAGASGTADVTVTSAQLLSIAIVPETGAAAPGEVIAFRALGAFDDGSTLDVTTYVTWTSNNTSVADVSNADGSRGEATTFAPGTVSIVARRGLVFGKAALFVK